MSKKNEDMKIKILKYIERHTEELGYPPSVREICTEVGLSSPSTVHGYLARMEREGFIERDSTKTRAIRVKKDEDAPLTHSKKNILSKKIDKNEIGGEEFLEIPVIGNVAAGIPITAQEQITDVFPLPARFAKNGEVFMLKVHGESMINIGIYDGDLVIVSRTETASNGEVVVAMIEDSATVKTFYREKDGRVRLQPENDTMQPIYSNEVNILGKVIGLFRTMI
ncbi:MAG: transcriptional repressor LexA [Bacillota bacterium]|nr:transcriptional repressor LexA [Bacillota bacterium]